MIYTWYGNIKQRINQRYKGVAGEEKTKGEETAEVDGLPSVSWS